MNWGFKILAGIIVFIAGMMTMVVIAHQQTNEMVDEEYYLKELQYQEVINAKNNLAQLADTVQIKDSLNMIYIQLPHQSFEAGAIGTITFMRPADKSKDISIPVMVDKNGIQIINKEQLSPGMYIVTINWHCREIPYYKEMRFVINN
ncbi:hypothetical protein PIECOFPK_01169 [Mycovorax composti]|jgi:FixH.|uniref:FixH protein n=2 Tax=Chitinophagaceae TaxID=563835 RepID=A0ABZ2EIU2_9BACT